MGRMEHRGGRLVTLQTATTCRGAGGWRKVHILMKGGVERCAASCVAGSLVDTMGGSKGNSGAGQAQVTPAHAGTAQRPQASPLRMLGPRSGLRQAVLGTGQQQPGGHSAGLGASSPLWSAWDATQPWCGPTMGCYPALVRAHHPRQ
jgi:hypothetical protein